MSTSISDLETRNDPVAHMAALHVEVIADLVCPFCYLGKRRLEQAMRAVQGPSEITSTCNAAMCAA